MRLRKGTAQTVGNGSMFYREENILSTRRFTAAQQEPVTALLSKPLTTGIPCNSINSQELRSYPGFIHPTGLINRKLFMFSPLAKSTFSGGWHSRSRFSFKT